MDNALKIECPNCHTQFALNETLAGPIIAQVRQAADAKVQKALQEAADQKKKTQNEAERLAERERELADQQAAFESKVNLAVAAERLKIQREEKERAEKELAPQREAERLRVAQLESDLRKAQTAELELRQQRDEIDEREKSLDLEVARRVDEERRAIQAKADQEADDKTKLRYAEYEKIIADMRKQMADAERTAAQKSQQLQGEVLEIDFEEKLRHDFPQDTITPVKAGARGGDILQSVMGQMGRSVGTIFWEFKRTTAWNNEWISKAKKDAGEAKAEVVMIVSENLPKDCTDFDTKDGVWFVRPGCAVVLAIALRQGLINTAEARKHATGKELKAEHLYEYMMGPEFRTVLEGIAVPFIEMKAELAKEQTSTINRWKRQEKRIERVLYNVAGLRGDLQGIGGMEMAQLPAFDEDEDIGADS